MSRAMRKHRYLQLKIFAAQLMELKKYISLLPGSSNAKKIDPEDLNEIVLHSVPKSWARQAYLQGWILRSEPTRTHATCLNARKSHNWSTKDEHLLKILSGKNPTVPVLAGRKREGGTPRHPTLRMSALASARETMQDIRPMLRPVQKRHVCCMAPGNIPNSAKCYSTSPKSTSRSNNLKTSKPATDATNAAKQPILIAP